MLYFNCEALGCACCLKYTADSDPSVDKTMKDELRLDFLLVVLSSVCKSEHRCMYILLPLWLSTDYYYYDYYSTTTISTTIITIPLKSYSNKLVNKRLLQRLIKQSFSGHNKHRSWQAWSILSNWSCQQTLEHHHQWGQLGTCCICVNGVKTLNRVHHENWFIRITIPSYFTKPSKQSRF